MFDKDLTMKSLTDESIKLLTSLSDETPETMANELISRLEDTSIASEKAYEQMKLLRLLPYLCESAKASQLYKIPCLDVTEHKLVYTGFIFPFYKLIGNKEKTKEFKDTLKKCYYYIDRIEEVLEIIKDFLEKMEIENDY